MNPNASLPLATSGRLKILLTINTPWQRSLGAPQAMIELGEAFSRMGHQVEKFSLEDAFPEAPPRGTFARLLRVFARRPSFSTRLADFLRSNGQEFDVVDANQTDIVVPKSALGYSQLLVCRSVGLIERYLENDLWTQSRWPHRGALRHRVRDLRAQRRMVRAAVGARRSIDLADLVNVSSSDDAAYLVQRGCDPSRVVHFPLGLAAERRAALQRGAEARSEPREPTVAFIGTWNYRKGAGDWPLVVRKVRERRPETRFLFLGVGIPATRVVERFEELDRPHVHAVESYSFEELPRLLAGADVGAFPGYLEGFGIGVLEMLAAGLPVAAYDAPGPRDILRGCPAAALSEPGEVGKLATDLVTLLALPDDRLRALSEAASAWSARFDWDHIAADTIQEYERRLAHLRTAR